MLEPKERLKIFVYGSLRTGFFNYDIYLNGKVKECNLGRIKGKLFHMPNKKYPALLDGEDYVYGEIMEVDNYEEVIVAMDKMEGYYEPNSKENEYNRIIVDVYNIDKDIIEKCYVYKYALNDKDIFDKHSAYINHGDWKKFMTNKL
ncbi:gamma-glutamylcyclotransferase family protein [Clostridium senegalense]|uniref:gamma-glutamylcyclotransferase family protein n=1 Tax=Clostridium senegalense TaxID=1465809 RepID=UPI000287E01C|nr:gamma-glutamylcyclotransferase family protein [Clostridium senegalense]